MLQKLYKLGTLLPEEATADDPLALSLDYRGEHVVLLRFDQVNGEWSYRGCETEALDPPKLAALLFKTKTGNWRSPFPTIDIFPGQLEHDEQIDFARSKAGKKFTAILKSYGKPFDGIRRALLQDPGIAADLARESRDLKRYLLSLRLDGQYLADSPFLATRITRAVEERYQDYYTYKKKRYEGHDQVCSLARKRSQRVWGCDAPYKFYAVKTELGSVPGGFNAANAWKNFPLAPASVAILLRGQRFLEQHLRFRLCGFSCFLVPEPILVTDGTRQWFWENIQDFQKLSTGENARGNQDIQADIIDMLAGEENVGTFTLLFFEENNSEFKILSSVEEVFPNYNLALLKARDKIEANPIYKDIPVKKDETIDVTFQFKVVKTFFPNDKKDGRFPATFLKLVRSIFMAKTIAKSFLLQHVMRIIRQRFYQGQYIKLKVLQALLLFEFLIELDLLEDKRTNRSKGVKMDEPYEAFFQAHRGFFQDSPAKKAVFLKGVLCNKLLDIQYARRNATPFRNRLGGLKLNARKLRSLLTEIINKLEEYDANYYVHLERSIAHYLLAAGGDYDQLEGEEYGFLFVLGMNLSDEVEPKKKKKESDQP